MTEVICLLPGLCDVPLHDLGGLTPLEKAPTPTIDSMETELFCPPEKGGCPNAFLAFLGIEHKSDLPLAPLEAYSLGFALAPAQCAYSARLISAGEGVMTDVSDHLVSDAEGKALFSSLPGNFFHLEGPLAVLITDQKLPCRVGCNPVDMLGRQWAEGLPCEFAQSLEQSLHASEISTMREELEEPPVNGLLFTEGGKLPKWEGEVCTKQSLLCTGSSALHGLARTMGVEVWRLPKEQRRLSTTQLLLKHIPDLAAKYDRLIVDIPHLWQSTYEGNLREKVKTIEWIDRRFLAPLLERWSLVVHPLRQVDIRVGDFVTGEVPVWRAPGGARSEAFLS
jgi:2,3-bisphosphoglycerate-independent phosphoglycerate mutase